GAVQRSSAFDHELFHVFPCFSRDVRAIVSAERRGSTYELATAVVESEQMTQVPIKTPAPPQGIIASLVTGFEAINARLELVVLPLALDLFLWFGPHLSISPLMPAVQAALDTIFAGTDPSNAANAQAIRTAVAEYGASFNVFSYLSTAPFG